MITTTQSKRSRMLYMMKCSHAFVLLSSSNQFISKFIVPTSSVFEEVYCFGTVARLVHSISFLSFVHLVTFVIAELVKDTFLFAGMHRLMFIGAFASTALAQAISFSNTTFTAPVTVGSTWPVSFSAGNGKPVAIAFGNSTYAFQIVGMVLSTF